MTQQPRRPVLRSLKFVFNVIFILTTILIISGFTTMATLTYIKLDREGLLPRAISMGGFAIEPSDRADNRQHRPHQFKLVPKRERYDI